MDWPEHSRGQPHRMVKCVSEARPETTCLAPDDGKFHPL